MYVCMYTTYFDGVHEYLEGVVMFHKFEYSKYSDDT